MLQISQYPWTLWVPKEDAFPGLKSPDSLAILTVCKT